MEYTTDNLEKVVTAFYRSEAGQQAQAHQWLTEAQNSQQAWSFVWELLQPQRSSEVQFFAATTLHTKLLKHWNEVPQDHYEQLKKKILESIINYAMGPKIILNRLCITLSAYVIHTLPNYWPNAIEELVANFQPHNLPSIEPERVIWILLEILTVIPEEFQSTSIPSAQKSRVRHILEGASKDILKVIEMCLVTVSTKKSDNITTYLNSARCASTWLQFGGVCISECGTIAKHLLDIICQIYWERPDPDDMPSDEFELMEASIEALSAMMTHPHTHKYPGVIKYNLSMMLDALLKIVDTEQNKKDYNKDIICNIYGLIISISDTHSKFLIQSLTSDKEQDKDLSLLIFRAILDCSALPGTYPMDESSSTLTFGFWYTLQDDVFSLDEQDCATCLEIIRPYYQQLVSVMIRKSMFPNYEDEGRWSLDDKEVFRCYRQDIADTMIYCYNVLNVEMLEILHNKMNEAIGQCIDDGKIVSENWPHIEACLHAYFSIAESIDYENLYLPKLMFVLKEIPYQELHTRVLATALDTVGAYAEWIVDHPEMLQNVIPFLTSGLSNPEVSASATMALKDLTNNCQRYMAPFANYILHACQSALQSGQLKLAECIRIMFSIGKVLSIMPIPIIMEYLNVILMPYFEELRTLLSSEPSQATAASIVSSLKLLSALYSALNVMNPSGLEKIQQPVFLVVQNTVNMYKQIASSWSSNTDVMEVLCTLLKHVVPTLADESKPLTNDILQLLVSSYRSTPQACILNVAKTILIMFGKDENYSDSMQILLCELVSITLEMCTRLTESGENNLSQEADVLESFFSMISQVTKKNPKLIQTQGLDTVVLFQCATVCLALPELQVIKASAMCLSQFIMHSRETSLINVVQDCGEQLVLRILLNLGGAAPRSAIDPMSDLLLTLNKKYCDSLARWLNGFLSQDGFPSARITAQQKELFIRNVLREKANKRKLTESVLEFTLICRGILRSESSTP